MDWRFKHIWKLPIPPSTKVFLFLMLRDKLLTKEVMLRRQFNCSVACVLCDSNQLETATHLFLQCEYARAIWEGIGNFLGTTMLVNAIDVQQAWLRSTQRLRSSPRARRRWQIHGAAVCWAIWRQRNSQIGFRWMFW